MSNLIPEGTFKVKIINAAFGESETKGTPYVRVTVELTEGEFKGRTIWKDYWFSDLTWEQSLESIQKIGFVGDDITNVQPLVGKLASAGIARKITTDYKKNNEVKTDKQGNPIWHNEVVWIGRDSTPTVKDAARAESFKELMRARIQQKQTGGGEAPAPPKQDDDLPDFMR